MSIFEADLKDLDRLVKDLKTFRKRALPHAVRNTLTATAFQGRKLWVNEIESSFVTRNKFTTRSLRVEKAKLNSNIATMSSTLGSVAPYMGLQETGGTEQGKGASKPIPTASAAGQAKGTRPRTKVVRKRNRLGAIQITKRRVTGGRKQRTAIAISMAATGGSGSRFAVIETNRGKGIFRVTGRKRGRAPRFKGVRIRMVWDLSKRSVPVPRHPTLQRTLTDLERLTPSIARKAIIDQLRFHRVLGF